MCLGRTHALMAAAAYATIGQYVAHQPPAILATGTALAASAGVLSDWDTQGSCVALSFGWITEAMAWCIHRLSGGHREWTHTGVGDVFCALLAVVAIALEPVHFLARFHAHGYTVSRHLSVGELILGAYLAILFGAGMKALRIIRKDLWREAAAIGLAMVMVVTGWDTGGIAWAILLGTVVHAIGDGLTEHGEAYFRPLTKHVFHLLPKRLRISTGHFVERRLLAPAMVLALGFLAWHMAVVSLPGSRL